MTNVISEEQAVEEFETWAENMDLDLDPSKMDPEDRTGYERHRRRILRAIQRGGLVFDDEGFAVFTPQNARSTYRDPITFKERTGATVLAADGKKKNQDGARTYAAMADICSLHPSTFSKLRGEDIKVCEALFSFLMD